MRKLAVLLLLFLFVAPVAAHERWPVASGIGAGGGVMTSDFAGSCPSGGGMTYDASGLYGCPPTADAAPGALVIAAKPVVVTPGATNVTGADLVLAPSPGENTLEGVTRASSTGDKLTFLVVTNGVATITDKIEGTDWDCDGAASDIICVCNLYTELFTDSPITGVTVTRTDSTCSDEKLTFSIDPGAAEGLLVSTDDDTNVDITNGTDGMVVIPGGSAAFPGLCWAEDNDGSCTGFYRQNADVVAITNNGLDEVRFTGSSVVIINNDLSLVAGELIWGSNSRIDGTTDGQICLNDAAAATNICLDFTTDAQLELFDGDGASAASFAVTGTVAVGNLAAIDPTIAITARHDFGEADGNSVGVFGTARQQETTGATASIVTGVRGTAQIAALSTQDYTNTVGLRSVVGQPFTLASSTGTITGAAGFYVMEAGEDGATITNQYGVYVEALTVGTNNYGLFVNTPTGTIADAIHVVGGRTFLGGNLETTGNIGTTVATIDVDGATMFATTRNVVQLTCTGAETITTITGGVSGQLLTLLHEDTDCTLDDTDDDTADQLDLEGANGDIVGAADLTVQIVYTGSHWLQTSSTQN